MAIIRVSDVDGGSRGDWKAGLVGELAAQLSGNGGAP